VNIGFIEEDYSSEWAFPSFTIKKNVLIRVFNDFKKLSLLLNSHLYPISKIEHGVRG
jgi:hypothetical protein